MHGTRDILHDRVHVLHTRTDTEGEKVCPPLHAGQCVFHHEVSKERARVCV